jgi:predicted ATPase
LQIGQNETEPTIVGYLIVETEAHILGNFVSSIDFAERALALFDPKIHHELASRYSNFDLQLELLAGLALSKWHVGYADQSRELENRAMQIVRVSDSPYIVGQGLTLIAYQLECQRRFEECVALANDLIRFASEHEYHLYLCHANLYRGIFMVEHGQAEAGLALVSEAITALHGGGNTMAHAHFSFLLSRALASVGRLQEAIDLVDSALANVAASGEHNLDAELTRLKGGYLWKQGAPLAAVEAHFEEAIAIARQQGAKMLELRATVSLCTLWQQQGKGPAAHTRLATLYAWFTEGFDTPDLQAARTLLNALA